MKPETFLLLMTVSNQARLRHWQTTSYAEHVALALFYTAINDFTDKLVEVTQGINETRLLLPEGAFLTLENLTGEDIVSLLQSLQSVLTIEFGSDRREVQNLRDEFLATVDKTLYLLTLK